MKRKKILLADDVDLFLQLEKTFFHRDKFDLLAANDGMEALEIVEHELPDLVFMDLHMPGMEGSQCCAAIKRNEKTREIPVVMVTHSGRAEDIEECRKAGCDALLFKPLNRQDFLDTAHRFLSVEEHATPRVPARICIYHGINGDETLTDYSVNLSTGGLFLETTRLLPAGTPLITRFTLPVDAREVFCNAKVAWVNHPELIRKPELPVGMGIQFIDITLDDMDAIRDYLKARSVSAIW